MHNPILALGKHFWTASFRKQGLSRVVANPSKVSVSFTTQQTRFSQIPFTAAFLQLPAIQSCVKLEKTQRPRTGRWEPCAQG